ncbi:MAG: Xaa-Pro peptidase family protein [Candidatus Promineifilaceae bacterium]|nr:Xaa-Pro peptidase family protein [Candidatus Promineifilaceae bacterium]
MMDDRQLIQEKVAQATNILNEFDVDTWLTFVRETPLSPDPALELILGMHVTWQSAFLLNRSGRHVAIVGHYDAENVRNLGVYGDVLGYHEGIGETLRAVLDEVQPRQIAVNYSTTDVAADGLSHGMFLLLQRTLQDTEYAGRLRSAEKVVAALRGRKSPAEVARMRQAISTTEKLFDEVEAHVRPGMTQRQIADFVHGRIDDMGLGYAWDKPYNPIVTCGPESAVGHAAPGDVPLERGHTLHMDLGVKENGYCSDLQRMWYVLDEGESTAPPDVQRAFDVVREALVAGERALRPGVPGWQVDKAARDVVVERGYPEYMHAFGHLLGRSAHDGATVLGPRWERYEGICELPVEMGNVFTLELHVPIPERGIMSLEEDVLVKEDGVEYLSDPQTELRTIR